MSQRDQAFQELVPDKMAIQLNVLGSVMINWILGNVYGSLSVAFEWNRGDVFNCELM